MYGFLTGTRAKVTARNVTKALTTQLLDALFPQRCVICTVTVPPGPAICTACEAALPVNAPACRQCALPLPPPTVHETAPGSLCGRCIRRAPAFDYAHSLFRYEGDIIRLIHQLKFSARLTLCRPLGERLQTACEQQLFPAQGRPDCLLPVPLHVSRLRRRGYNQSTEIIRRLAKNLALPVDLHTVRRQRSTTTQTGLDARQRRRNIRAAFGLRGAPGYRHVLIVDDVVTTGATVDEIARLLKRGGVEKVGVLSVARAPIK